MALDKYGNETTVIGCKDPKNNGKFPKGWFEWKGQLFKVEPSPANKEGVDAWVKITAMKSRPASSFGGGKSHNRGNFGGR